MYFVFSYSIHNYRVKIAWDEREVEFNKVKAELSQVKDGLTSDEAWLAGAAAKVKAARANAQGSVLRIDAARPKTVGESKPVAQAKTE